MNTEKLRPQKRAKAILTRISVVVTAIEVAEMVDFKIIATTIMANDSIITARTKIKIETIVAVTITITTVTRIVDAVTTMATEAIKTIVNIRLGLFRETDRPRLETGAQ